jgi:rubrerythrin
MDHFNDYESRREFWDLVDGDFPGEFHADEYRAMRRQTQKWLVYYLHHEDYTFMPVAIVDAQDADEACWAASASGARVPEALVELKARRFTRDLEDGDYVGQTIECAACGREAESENDALCPKCLERFMSGGIDQVKLIPK